MLRRVTVENYALIDSISIEFGEGLNIITGETGAGKSLLLGALSVVMGGRTEAGVLRDQTKNCVIEAEFDINSLELESEFERLELDYEGITVIRRVINPAGKSRAFVNDMPVNVSVLKELCDSLIDIHSQHQTLLLGSNKFQTELLDSVAKNSAVMQEYLSVYTTLTDTIKRIDGLRKIAQESAREQEYLKFQYDQLVKAELKEGEIPELEELLNELSHASQIKETMLEAEGIISSDEDGVISRLKSIEQMLRRTSKVFAKSAELDKRVSEVLVELKDIAEEMACEGDRMETDPRKLESIEVRLAMLYDLQQKHHTDDLIALRQEIEAKIGTIEGYSTEIESLEKDIKELNSKAQELAGRITASRLVASPIVEKRVTETMSQLGIPNVRFVAEITPQGELQRSGADKVRFLFSANKNAPLQPIEQTASGGEMSRLMLSLKALVCEHRQLPTLILDEIDTGVSGMIADKMGNIINEIAENMQVVNITHLPQVAAKGGTHLFVYKEDSATATNTRIKHLTQQERVVEIAKMLSGAEISDAAMVQAIVLLHK